MILLVKKLGAMLEEEDKILDYRMVDVLKAAWVGLGRSWWADWKKC